MKRLGFLDHAMVAALLLLSSFALDAGPHFGAPAARNAAEHSVSYAAESQPLGKMLFSIASLDGTKMTVFKNGQTSVVEDGEIIASSVALAFEFDNGEVAILHVFDAKGVSPAVVGLEQLLPMLVARPAISAFGKHVDDVSLNGVPPPPLNPTPEDPPPNQDVDTGGGNWEPGVIIRIVLPDNQVIEIPVPPSTLDTEGLFYEYIVSIVKGYGMPTGNACMDAYIKLIYHTWTMGDWWWYVAFLFQNDCYGHA